MARILIVEDDEIFSRMLLDVLGGKGHEVELETHGEHAVRKYQATPFDIVLCDIHMMPMDGLTVLRLIKEFDPRAVVIVMTGCPTTDYAVECFRAGGLDFLQKPLRFKELLAVIDRAEKISRLQGARTQTTQQPFAFVGSHRAGPDFILRSIFVGKTEPIQRLINQVDYLITRPTPILVQGETGTGKRTLTRFIHHYGSFRNGPLIEVNAAGSTTESLWAGLIGDEGKGGPWLDSAAGGVLAIHNIEKLPIPLQDELQGILSQDTAQFRLIVTTTTDLDKLLDSDEFSEKLYMTAVMSATILLPTLRDTINDVSLLVRHFALEATGETKVEARDLEFAPELIAELEKYNWPGNFGELRKIVRELVRGAKSTTIGPDLLPFRVRPFAQWPTLQNQLWASQIAYLREALEAAGGDRERAAAVLEIDLDIFEQCGV